MQALHAELISDTNGMAVVLLNFFALVEDIASLMHDATQQDNC